MLISEVTLSNFLEAYETIQPIMCMLALKSISLLPFHTYFPETYSLISPLILCRHLITLGVIYNVSEPENKHMVGKWVEIGTLQEVHRENVITALRSGLNPVCCCCEIVAQSATLLWRQMRKPT